MRDIGGAGSNYPVDRLCVCVSLYYIDMEGAKRGYNKRGKMATWNEYKDHVRKTNPEIGKDIDEIEANSRIRDFQSMDDINAWIEEERRRPLPSSRKILRNAARCNHCGDVIESIYRHNFVTCSCGRVSVDGGLDYLRRCAENPDDYTDLSETESEG